MLLHGILAEVKLFSKPYHASAKVICFPFPVPLPMNEYFPSQFESPQVVLASVWRQ